MCGDDPRQAALFSYLSPEERVPTEHPLRAFRAMVDGVLTELSCPFDARYVDTGRPSMAPEQWLRALRLPVLYTIRRERLLLEQLDDHLLCRWVVGLNMDDAVWDATVFSEHRERLLAGEVAQAFFDWVLAQVRARAWRSAAPFIVDGTRLEAWAGQQSLKRKELASPSPPPDDPGNLSIDVRRTRRPHAPQTSTTGVWKRSWGGSRPSGGCGRCGSVESPGWAGYACVPRRHTTGYGCARRRQWHEDTGRQVCRTTAVRCRPRSSRGCTAVGCPKEPPVAHPELLLAPLSRF